MDDILTQAGWQKFLEGFRADPLSSIMNAINNAYRRYKDHARAAIRHPAGQYVDYPRGSEIPPDYAFMGQIEAEAPVTANFVGEFRWWAVRSFDDEYNAFEKTLNRDDMLLQCCERFIKKQWGTAHGKVLPIPERPLYVMSNNHPFRRHMRNQVSIEDLIYPLALIPKEGVKNDHT